MIHSWQIQNHENKTFRRCAGGLYYLFCRLAQTASLLLFSVNYGSNFVGVNFFGFNFSVSIFLVSIQCAGGLFYLFCHLAHCRFPANCFQHQVGKTMSAAIANCGRFSENGSIATAARMELFVPTMNVKVGAAQVAATRTWSDSKALPSLRLPLRLVWRQLRCFNLANCDPDPEVKLCLSCSRPCSCAVPPILDEPLLPSAECRQSVCWQTRWTRCSTRRT